MTYAAVAAVAAGAASNNNLRGKNPARKNNVMFDPKDFPGLPGKKRVTTTNEALLACAARMKASELAKLAKRAKAR